MGKVPGTHGRSTEGTGHPLGGWAPTGGGQVGVGEGAGHPWVGVGCMGEVLGTHGGVHGGAGHL